MLLAKQSDTSTPFSSTQTSLKIGAFKQNPLKKATVLFGTAVAGLSSYSFGFMPTNSECYEAPGIPETKKSTFAPVEQRYVSVAIDKDADSNDFIPQELQSYLNQHRSQSSDAVLDTAEELFWNSRVIPPIVREHKMRVRLKFIGVDAPRIRTEEDFQ